MQTNFTLTQLADPNIAESEKILRKCVHCGFCTATCPTFNLLGDELDSPRGRIYLIKDMLENDRAADRSTVKHIDRCLSCLSCMTTCPSGVNYMHLVDHARTHIEKTFQRPLFDRMIRAGLAFVLPYSSRFRLAVRVGKFAKPFASLFRLLGGKFRKISNALELIPPQIKSGIYKVPGEFLSDSSNTKGRIALLSGCAQQVLNPSINDATIRLLTRIGYDVVIPNGETCCGALTHHLGKEDLALQFVRQNIDVWWKEIEVRGLDAIVMTASGCGTMVKDYEFLLRNDSVYSERAAKVASLVKDVTEFLSQVEFGKSQLSQNYRVTYHSACSMQHGQKIAQEPINLLTQAGFDVSSVPEGYMCCGSAGTYNMLQPEIANNLRARKVKNIRKTEPNIVSTGNIGCMTQLSGSLDVPIVHTIELLDWAYGGNKPSSIR